MVDRSFKFHKNNQSEWYLELPEWSGDPADLQMVEGADQWLDLLAQNKNQVVVRLSDHHFEGAEILTLIRLRDANLGGGGYYYLENYRDSLVGIKLWLCEVTRFVFDQIPQKIYFLV
ncbi:MAG: hypothetical protein REI93_10145 [Pedobacter sp.]|nr:hypothetical protein [Pedobacter sp.]